MFAAYLVKRIITLFVHNPYIVTESIKKHDIFSLFSREKCSLAHILIGILAILS